MADERIRRIVERALRAPSVHNTQPWEFHATGDDTLVVRADAGRQLPVLDPLARNLVISCGAALDHARLAARAEGLDAGVDTLPDARDPLRMADIHLAPGAPASPEEQELVAAIDRRRTHRSPFTDEPVPDGLLDALQEAAAHEGAYLRVVRTPRDLAELVVLLNRADRAESDDPAYREELTRWRMVGNDGAEGVPDAAVPDVDRASRHSSLAIRDFDVDHSVSVGEEADDAPAERPAVVILVTDGDEPADWLTAGRALSQVLLLATARGLAASPLNQVVDLPATRSMLRNELALLGHPQMVLRLGYAADTGPVTGRRDVGDVLREG